MPVLDFPDAPTIGQQYTSGLQTWEWDSISWNIVPTIIDSGGGEASIAVGPDAPVGPDDGDLWWDTDEPSIFDTLVDVAALAINSEFTSRYPAKPSAGVVYGINHYNAVLGGVVTVTQVGVTILTISMPVAGLGALLDISFNIYMNSIIGHGGGFVSMWVNAVQAGPTIVVPDITALASWSGRIANVVPPSSGTYNIELKAAKGASGGTLAAQSVNTAFTVVSYRL